MNICNDQQELDYLEYESLGIVADLLVNINPNNVEIAIRMHANRLNIIKKYLYIDLNGALVDKLQPQNDLNNNSNRFKQKQIFLIYDCFESLSKCYALNDDFDNVLKFKFVQLKLCSKNSGLNKFRIRISFDLANLLLFKLNNLVDAKHYFEHALSFCDEINITKPNENSLLLSLVYGNLGM